MGTSLGLVPLASPRGSSSCGYYVGSGEAIRCSATIPTQTKERTTLRSPSRRNPRQPPSTRPRRWWTSCCRIAAAQACPRRLSLERTSHTFGTQPGAPMARPRREEINQALLQALVCGGSVEHAAPARPGSASVRPTDAWPASSPSRTCAVKRFGWRRVPFGEPRATPPNAQLAP